MNELMTLKEVEVRIGIHVRSAANALIEVGRDLNDAKALVKHGEWESWVREHTGMSLRTAQQWMQAAKEVPAGSYMEKLDISKISMILTLPEAEREPVAKKAAEEGATVKVLRREIEALKGANMDLEENRKNLRENMRKLQAGIEDERMQRAKLEADRESLQRKYNELQHQPSPEQAAIIEELRDDLAFAEAQAEEQARLAKAARDELTNREMCARHDESVHTTIADVVSACRAFMGAAAVLPHMGRKAASLSDSDRAELNQYIDMVERWVHESRGVVNVQIVELSVVQ